LANWLYGVAFRTAQKALSAGVRRRQKERKMARPEAVPNDVWHELRPVLDRELNSLPDIYREPVILCDVEGHTHKKAAQLLGCPEGTLSVRLKRAREMLAKRLKRRGLTLAGGAAALVISKQSATAALSAPLVSSTVHAAAMVAAGHAVAGVASAPVAALTEGVLKAMFRCKLTFGAALAVALGALGISICLYQTRAAAAPENVVVARASGESEKEKDGGSNRQKDDPGSRSPETKPGMPDKKDFAVAGKVVDADGWPIPDAKVAVMGFVQPLYRGNVGNRGHETLGTGETDKDGHFRFDCVAESAIRFPLRQVLASAAGHGLGWQHLKLGNDNADMVVKLPSEQVIRGRLIDLQGQPVKGGELHVAAVAPAKEDSPHGATPPAFGFANPPKRLDLWPAPLTTDAEGRFVVHGLGRNMSVTLLVDDGRFARHELVVQTTAKGKPEQVEQALEPARMLEGKVVGEDTGKPIGKVLLSMDSGQQHFQEWTDEQGRFRFNCPPARGIAIYPFPANGSAYLTRVTGANGPRVR
jgi:hypothetical protein